MNQLRKSDEPPEGQPGCRINDDVAEGNVRQAGPKEPPPSLGPMGLTLGLVFLTLIPFLFVVTLYLTLPTTKDPELMVQATVAPRSWTSSDGAQSRIVPSLVLKNPTDDEWQNVNLSINGQYDYFHPKPIAAGEELILPLKFFHTDGNQFFSLENQPLLELTVYAQIPSGARAIKKIPGSELLQGDILK